MSACVHPGFAFTNRMTIASVGFTPSSANDSTSGVPCPPTYVGPRRSRYRNRSDARTMAQPPSEILRGSFSTAWSTRLRHCENSTDQVGTDQVSLAPDYPFDMGHCDIHALVRATDLTAQQRAAILGGNAARLLGLSGQSRGETRG